MQSKPLNQCGATKGEVTFIDRERQMPIMMFTKFTKFTARCKDGDKSVEIC